MIFFGWTEATFKQFVIDWEFKYGKSRSSHIFKSKETKRSKELFLCENVHAVTVSIPIPIPILKKLITDYRYIKF